MSIAENIPFFCSGDQLTKSDSKEAKFQKRRLEEMVSKLRVTDNFEPTFHDYKFSHTYSLLLRDIVR